MVIATRINTTIRFEVRGHLTIIALDEQNTNYCSFIAGCLWV